MGKAARRRKVRRMNYLVELSSTDPHRFQAELDKRISSWLSEIRRFARNWTSSEPNNHRAVFEILDEVSTILARCEVSAKFATEVLDTIRNECCTQVSRVLDPRLYRLSNTAELIKWSKASHNAHNTSQPS